MILSCSMLHGGIDPASFDMVKAARDAQREDNGDMLALLRAQRDALDALLIETRNQNRALEQIIRRLEQRQASS